jgi:MFS family permease
MAIFIAIAWGGTPIGAPIVGWIADRFGPRWALGVGAAAGVTAAVVGALYFARQRKLSLQNAEDNEVAKIDESSLPDREAT